MKFVNPYFLFGLFAIAVPVIVHLFNFRRFKRVYFSNVQFLKELKQETQKQSKLKHFLVLISRILAIIFLVLAFAQPYIPMKEQKSNARGNLVSIYIDNSFSMEALSSKGSLFDEAKAKALEIANSYKSTDLFQLLTNDFEGKHQAFYTREEFILLLKDIVISPSFKKLPEVLLRQDDMFGSVSSKRGRYSFVLSDFSKATTDFTNIKNDTNISVNLVPLVAGKSANVYIDSCWFDSPVMQLGRQLQLTVLIKNNAENDAEKIPVKLSVNGKQKTVASVDIPANSQALVKMPYTISELGQQAGTIEIVDYPIVFDDKFYFSYPVLKNIPVLSINETGENTYLNSLFGKDSAFVLTNMNVNKLDYSGLPDYKLVILDELKTVSSGLMEELKTYIEKGGCLLVFPGVDADLESYKTFLTSLGSIYYIAKDTMHTKVSSINTDHPVYRDVFEKIPDNIDLPIVKAHYTFSAKTASSDEYLMKMQNGESFMVSVKAGKGKVYLSSVPLNTDFSNFPKHAIFVPTMFNIALYSQPLNKLFYTIGQDEGIEVRNAKITSDFTFKITNKAKDFEVIPENRNIDLQTFIYPHDQIKESGNYALMMGQDSIAELSFNYDRRESVLDCYTVDELKNKISDKGLKNFNILDVKNKSVSQALEEIMQGFRMWRIFLVLALLCLVAEVALLRFVKN